MQSKFVDTNIFLEVFVRTGKKSEKSKSLLLNNKNLYSSSLVVSEIEWVMRTSYKINKKIIVRCLKKVLSLDIQIEGKDLLIKGLHFYEQNNVDWTDCLNMFLAKEKEITKVYSYDRGLDKYDWIKRLEP